MSTFWWEETYDPSIKIDMGSKARIPTDQSGEAFLRHRIQTSSSQLSGLITPNGELSIVLGDSGRMHSAVNCYRNDTGALTRSILVESKSGFMDLSSDGEILAVGVLKEDTIMIFHVTSGDYLVSVRGDRPKGFWGQLQFIPGSINYLVEHRVIEMQRSTAKKSVLRLWDLGFRSHPSNGQPIVCELQEALTVAAASSGSSLATANDNVGGGGAATEDAKATSVKKTDDDDSADEVDDEDAAQLWSTDMEGPACYTFNSQTNTILLNLENKRVIESYRITDGHSSGTFKSPLPPKLRAIIEASGGSSSLLTTTSSSTAPSTTAVSKKAAASKTASGGGRAAAAAASAKPAHNIKPIQIENESWSTKCVLSQNKKYFAVGHFGRVSVIDCSTGSIAGEVFSPIEDDTYPLVPLAFISDDNFLVCRINYDRILMVMSWRLPKALSMTYALKDLGGTISDACAVSPDGKWLICWPHGCFEIYNLSSVVNDMFRKYRKKHIKEMARIRSYVHRKVTKSSKLAIMDGITSRKDRIIFSLLCLDSQEIFANILSFM